MRIDYKFVIVSSWSNISWVWAPFESANLLRMSLIFINKSSSDIPDSYISIFRSTGQKIFRPTKTTNSSLMSIEMANLFSPWNINKRYFPKVVRNRNDVIITEINRRYSIIMIVLVNFYSLCWMVIIQKKRVLKSHCDVVIWWPVK